MAIQLILCVETDKRADTDSGYIYETIQYVYNVDNKTKLSKICMGGKMKYNSDEVRKEISNKRDMYLLGKSVVIYCIDTDQYEKNQEHNSDLNKIEKYCKDNGYELIWFCHDVEEVFLGKKISDSIKKDEVNRFKRNKKIKTIDLKMLCENNKRVHASNMLNILDKYLQRK